MNPPPSRSQHRAALATLVFFALLYALIFIPNHLLFRTYALDLGLYTHAAYSYAHGTMADSMLFRASDQLLLADHFDLHLILWSPLTYLFGQWTLLFVQWAAVLIGVWGMYRWLLAVGIGRSVATMGSIHFAFFFGIISAFTFDFHSNVVATMALPWYGLALHQRRIAHSWLLLAFMLVAKENMGIWLCAVAFGFVLYYRKDVRLRRILALHSGLALCWSVLVISFVMPALSHAGTYDNWKYTVLGDGPMAAVRTIVLDPVFAWNALFDGSSHESGQKIKYEMLTLLMISGGWIALFRPWVLIMALPLLLQKLWHEGPGQWGVLSQYSVEFAPLISFALFSWEPVKKGSQLGLALAGVAALLSIAVTFRVLDASVYRENRGKQRFYQVMHYQRDYDVKGVYSILSAVPPDATVSVSTPFLPHLTMRKDLFQYPILGNAEYILLATKEEPYPLSPKEFAEAQDSLRASHHWTMVQACDGAELFKRKR